MESSSSEKADEKQIGQQNNPNTNDMKTDQHAEATPPEPKKEPLPKRIMAALNLDRITLELMFKGAAAPTISIAIYQADAIAQRFTTIGYLIAIMSILSMPIMPRGKFILTMLMNVVGICIGSAIALLQCYCVTQARLHTTPKITSTNQNAPAAGARVTGYNSSASAVSAIWLIANIYFVNTLRATRPQLQLPVIMYSIFAMVSSTYAPAFPDMVASIAFVKRLLEAFLLGFGVAFGVSMVIFPKTCRGIFFLQTHGMIKVIQGILATQKAYIISLETGDIFSSSDMKNADDDGKAHHGLFHKKKARVPVNPANAKLKALIATAGELQGKIYADMGFAKRELAYGKLDAHDIDEIHKLFQKILLPLYGIGSTADIFARVAKQHGWTGADPRHENLKGTPSEKEQGVKHWNAIMKRLHEPFEVMVATMSQGLQHVAYTLELEKLPASKKGTKSSKAATGDIEAEAGEPKPGDRNYSVHLKKTLDNFYSNRQSRLKAMMEKEDMSQFEDVTNPLQAVLEARKLADLGEPLSANHKLFQRQLYMVLYMEFLLWCTGQGVLHFAEFADRKVEDGTMKRRRIINPGAKRLKKWLQSVFKSEDLTSTEQNPDATDSGAAGVYAGSSFQAKKDPEHLPPANAWERTTDGFRLIAKVLGSSSSGFGLRVAAATFTIGIVAYLKNSQEFFRDQRIVWAMIMVAIGMTTTSGAGVFGFFGRIFGTVVAMVTSLIIWYIVVGHAAGVIVFLFLFTFVEFYIILKYPRIIVIAIISIVTQVLIIGYELQVQKIGIKAAESTGQKFYDTRVLAPYRLATVAGGMFVAFIWTFFPFPLTERSQLRKDMGCALYLLANYYSLIHTSVGLRIAGKDGNEEDKKSPGAQLTKARSQVWDKEMALIASLRQHAAMTVWEPTFGGRFPKEIYDAIIDNLHNMLNYLALISYSSITFSMLNSMPQPAASESDPNPDSVKTWVSDFARLISSVAPTTQTYTSQLTLLAGAMTNGLSLPPYMQTPEGYDLSSRLEKLDTDVLSVRHVQEPGYAAFAVMQVASSLVRDDLEELIANVKQLVGEVDFSFHIHSTNAKDSEETLWERTKREFQTQERSDSTGDEKSRKQD